MPENYARENAGSKGSKDCKNSRRSSAEDSKAPMSKQNAAQRKTEDCKK